MPPSLPARPPTFPPSHLSHFRPLTFNPSHLLPFPTSHLLIFCPSRYALCPMPLLPPSAFPLPTSALSPSQLPNFSSSALPAMPSAPCPFFRLPNSHFPLLPNTLHLKPYTSIPEPHTLSPTTIVPNAPNGRNQILSLYFNNFATT